MKTMWRIGLLAYLGISLTASGGVNDYMGVGRSDLGVFDRVGGDWYVKSVEGPGMLWMDDWGWSTVQVVPGDYNGDGLWDQAVFDPAGGYWYIRSVKGAIILWKNQWGGSTANPVPGDYDGDGKWDLAVFERAGGYWYIKSGTGSVLLWNNQWGGNTVKPVPGDYDGDGKWDLAVFDPAGGYWYIKRLNGTLIAWQKQWGWSTATPVPGDYDGDGKYDLALFDAAGGYWYIKSLSGTLIAWQKQWGWSTVTPVPGDYDGDGKFDLAVYDTVAGHWFIKSVGGTLIAWQVQWGWPGAVPVPIFPVSGMASIPGGTSSGVDPDFGAYSLTVTSFDMDRTEVTKAKWEDVRRWGLNHGYTDLPTGGGKAMNHPVHSVKWYDVVKWCNARSQKEMRTVAYYRDSGLTQIFKTGQVTGVNAPYVRSSANGYRLPTATQWEYAARGGVTSKRFPWGGNLIDHEKATYIGNPSAYAYDSGYAGYDTRYLSGGSPYASPVGSFEGGKNGYGLFDISGNVWEWCFNWRAGDEGTNREIRGGSWFNEANYCRIGYRSASVPYFANNSFGFRTVLPP